MKKLIFASLFVSLPVLATEVQEIPEAELAKKFVATVKDREIEETLKGSTEFNECLQKNKFDPKVTDAATIKKKAEEAEACFKDKLKGKKPDEINKLSENLGLQSYGLVPGKDQVAITGYLADKMYKALTGIDRKEEREKREFEDFKKKKIVDQKVFVELYTNHLNKTALQEISRFCFQNLRNDGALGASFMEHWKTFFASSGDNLGNVHDNGKLEDWGNVDLTDENKSYEVMFQGIAGSQASLDPGRVSVFFKSCAKSIDTLCKKFQADTTQGVGANACLTQGRLQEVRTAIGKIDKVKKQFDQELAGGMSLDGQVKFYDRGQSNPDETIDNLTNVSSLDYLEGGQTTDQKKMEQLKDTCSQNPESPECKEFYVIDDSLEKTKHTVDIEMRLKKEAEVQRILELKKQDKKKLSEYLKDNGYLHLLAEFEKNPDAVDFEAEIRKIYDGKREALLKGIQDKLGNRQMSEEQWSKMDNAQKGAAAKKNVEEVQQERARMAQVVLFNNIITSHLSLTKKEGGKEVDMGRNVNAWKKEEKNLEGGGVSINSQFFTGLKNSANDGGAKTDGNELVSGLSFLDDALGAPAKDEQSGN